MFINERGRPFGRMGIGRMVERAGEAARLPFPVHVHMLRHLNRASWLGYCHATSKDFTPNAFLRIAPVAKHLEMGQGAAWVHGVGDELVATALVHRREQRGSLQQSAAVDRRFHLGHRPGVSSTRNWL